MNDYVSDVPDLPDGDAASVVGGSAQAGSAGQAPSSHEPDNRLADLVDNADRELAGLAEAPLPEHVAAYTRIHETLQRELAAIDNA